MPRRPKALAKRIVVPGCVALALVGLSACGSGEHSSRVDPAADVVSLPGAMRGIDFDDIVYSDRLGRVLVPARRSGLYVVDPANGQAERVGHVSSADSADEGRGLLFVLDRGIEIFTVPEGPAPTPRHAAFVPVPDGPEGLEWSAMTRKAYTHAGADVTAVDLGSRAVTARWSTGCDGTHGFPRVDEHDALLLASCNGDGEVVLLDLDDGRRLDRYAVGDGEALPGYSSRSNHFYVRGDPGTRLATLAPSSHGLRLVKEVAVPEVGHCLTGDTVGHYWTCDADGGRILRFDDR